MKRCSTSLIIRESKSKLQWGITSHSSESDQIRSIAQLCPTLCDPMNRSTPGLPVHHQFLEFTETHIHQVSDAIQPSHPLSSPYIRMYIIKKPTNNNFWRRCGEKGTLLHCWWQFKLVQPLQKTVCVYVCSVMSNSLQPRGL